MTHPVRRAAAALALAAALVTTGCGATEADRAAVVDGTVITETEVQAVMSEVNGMEPALLQEKLTPSSALTTIVRARPAIAFFAEKGVVASDTVAEQEARSRGVENPSDATLEVIRFVHALRQAAAGQRFTAEDETELITRIQEQHVEVNPRYGAFDPDSAAVAATLPEWVTLYDAPQ